MTNFLDLFRFLQMERTKFEVDHENAAFGLGTHDVPCKFKPVDCGIAAHEAYHCAFSAWIKL